MKTAWIFQGGWDGHEPRLTSKRFSVLLQKYGYETVIYDTLDPLGDLEALKKIDLVVACWTMGQIKHEYVVNLAKAIGEGVGLAGCHGGMCDAFRENTEWQFITGGQWVSHPGGDGIPYKVNICHGSSPIVEGLEDFDVCSEHYYLHIDPAIEVLATTRFPIVPYYHISNKPVDMPVAWTKYWGNGRVFYTSLGHHDDVFEKSPAAETLMERGMVWAGEGKQYAIDNGLTPENSSITPKCTEHGAERKRGMKKVNVAMIGVGCISGIYLENITKTFTEIRLLGVCDLIRERAEAAKEKYDIPRIYDTMYDAFQDPEVDLILNLTRPYEHFDVSWNALMAGKHVYSEKPLGASLEEGQKLKALAEEKGLMLGGAPDTFMGAGIQTCRKLIDDGFIGTPIGSAAFMICHGHESWHPDPDFYYQYGGGPMMDMGPYYLTAMVNLMGGIKRVFSASRATYPTRMITSQPFAGTPIQVNVNTYVAGTLEYESGAIGTLFTTFDVYYNGQARFEIYGSEGTLIVPDPNGFGGPVKLLRAEEKEYREMPLLFDYAQNSRGLGLADMAKAIQTGRPARADYQQTFHVLDAITGFDRSAGSGQWVEMSTKYTRRPPMARPVLKGILD